MERKNKTIPWSEEEITLLKFYYAFKDKFSWNEISEKMKKYTNIERSSTALMTKIDRLKRTKEAMDKTSIKQLYDEIILTRKNGEYSYYFKKHIINNFSKYFGTPDEITEDTSLLESVLKMNQELSKDVVEVMDDFDQYHTEDDYSEFKLSDHIYSITMWTIWICVFSILIYLVVSYYHA